MNWGNTHKYLCLSSRQQKTPHKHSHDVWDNACWEMQFDECVSKMEGGSVFQGDPNHNLSSLLSSLQRLPLPLGVLLHRTGGHAVGLQRARQQVGEGHTLQPKC